MLGNRPAPCARLLPSIALSLCFLVSFLPRLCAQQKTTQESAPPAEAVAVEHPPKLDGTLDDPLWQPATPVTDFRQQEPLEGQPATEKTEVRILYTRHAVYFGIHCFDSNPSRIIASELRRDVSQDLDDHFEILIHSNHDRRGGYVFQINPLGTQMDGLIVEEQRDSFGLDFDSSELTSPFHIYKSVFIPDGIYQFARHQLTYGSGQNANSPTTSLSVLAATVER